MTLKEHIYNNLKKIAEFSGYNLFVTKKNENENHKIIIVPSETRAPWLLSESHEIIMPEATYAPWSIDKSFNETYEIIKGFTLIDKYRCYELWQLVSETAKLKGALLEVGVYRGGSGALIGKKAKLIGIKDKVYLCDTFTGVVKAGSKDSWYKGGEHKDTTKETVQEVIHKLKLDKTEILEGIFPDETGEMVTDTKFRFCHIDVDVYQSAKDIVDWLWPRLVTGGIIVFDDYGFGGCDGVTHFVNEERNKEDRLVIHNLNGHAIVVKL